MKRTIFILLLFLTTSVCGQLTPQQKPMHGLKINWAQPLSKGLVGVWLFNEGSGNTVFDLSGNENHGTFVNSTSWKAGKFGPCIRTGGFDDHVDLGINTYDLGLRRNATFCIWAKIDDITPVGDSALISDWNDSLGFNLFIDNSPAGGITAYIYPDNYRVSTAAGVIHEGWNFVCCVWDGVNVSIYHDGIYKAQVALNGDVGDSSTTLKLGVRGDLAGDYIGLLDLPMIYNHALSAGEIALLYREPFCMFQQDVPLMAVEAPVPGRGQVIMITSLPVLFIGLYICRKYKEVL